MPLLSMSPNIQDGGTATPSRKRSLMDYLEKGANKPATPSKLKLVTDATNLASLEKEKEHQTEQKTLGSPTDVMSIDSPLSEMSDGEMSLLTDDAGSSTPARSTSPNATPGKFSGSASPHLVIDLDGTPPPGLAVAMAASTTTKPLGTAPPPKRKKLTPSEREEKAKADAARKAEKEKADAAKKLEKEKAEAARKLEKEKKEKAEALKKQERDEQKAIADAKKKAIAEEKEKKRKQKEEEDRRKNEEKEKKRKEKEDEERRVQEAKDKKERSQLRLNSFFKTGGSGGGSNSNSTSTSTTAFGSSLAAGSSPLKPVSVRGNSVSPQKSRTSGGLLSSQAAPSDSDTVVVEVSEYDRIFKPFFIKENVTMATDLYGMDDETKEAKSRILDEFLSGSRGDFSPKKPFSTASAVDYFHLPSDSQSARGRNRPTVRKIMNMLGPDAIYGGLSAFNASDAQTKLALDLLKSVPMKYLFFREDVRPAYFGTVTSQPPQARLSKLARNPLAKTVLPLNYDYDSEAEWVDDGDGEDVDDLDDEEEELEDDGEMSDFLDDSEDAMPLRPAFSGGMEPESTGICWENERRQAPQPDMDCFRMEFILDHDGPMDPFSTQYWETKEVAPAPDATTTSTNTPSKTMAPPPAPADAFAALGAGAAAAATPSTPANPDVASTAGVSSTSAPASSTTATSKPTDTKKTAGVATEFVPDLKKSILQYAKLSKLGIVEILSVEFMGKCTKAQIKNSLEALAERTGTGQNKTWKLKA
ncbi:chromatin assembly factor-I (CAF-I) p90 subunit [Sporothrix eucalyptigena]|uniref:Chromatin assembly factor-I (CAF-I) p90 subunit n=1 Tax=Sporothrix eucalyptigena TaxID=1812306 RepID=A0ABP0CZS5_9PEZI